MVAAGVFLIGRFLPIFPEEVLIITALIGAITAFGAALLGTVMNDVKKVLAYSTISQLGYMVMALGIGMSLYTAAFFHLFTHAFFKALLFLVAGSLSHSVGTFDMKKMGGLRKLMPWTYLFFIIGTFSLIGLFPFSGFWSKDEILSQISHEHTAIANIVYYLGSAAVFLTSFYMFRAMFMIFAGKYDKRKNPGVSVHESGLILLIPMAILAVASIFFGFIFNSTIDLGIIESHWFNKFIKPDYHSHAFDFNVAIISHILVILGFMSAYIQYRYMKSYKSKLIIVIQNVLLQKYYLDIFYEKIVVKNIMYKNIIGLLNYIDTKFIDGTWDQIAITTKTISSRLSFIQNGQLQFYSFGIPLGIIIMSLLVILWR
jgi:NADH-quinone oxidoreductase subunit L